MKYKLSNTITTQDRGHMFPIPLKTPRATASCKAGDTLIFYTYMESRSALNQKSHMEIEVLSNNPDLVVGLSVLFLNNASGTIHGWKILNIRFRISA